MTVAAIIMYHKICIITWLAGDRRYPYPPKSPRHLHGKPPGAFRRMNDQVALYTNFVDDLHGLKHSIDSTGGRSRPLPASINHVHAYVYAKSTSDIHR